KERKLWFSDIQINPHNAYFPFVRLALCRFQPNSLFPASDAACNPQKPETCLDARISAIAVSDFAQLTPDRWAHVQRIDHKNFKVTISGVSYYSSMEGQVGPTRMRIAVQKRMWEMAEELDWITKEEIEWDKFTVTENNNLTIWETP